MSRQQLTKRKYQKGATELFVASSKISAETRDSQKIFMNR